MVVLLISCFTLSSQIKHTFIGTTSFQCCPLPQHEFHHQLYLLHGTAIKQAKSRTCMIDQDLSSHGNDLTISHKAKLHDTASGYSPIISQCC